MARRPLEPGTSEAQPAKRRPRRQLQPEVGAGSTGRDGGRLPEVFEPSDLWRFMCHFGHRLKHNVYGVDFLHVLIIVLCVGCDMVTDFSGLGAPEIAGIRLWNIFVVTSAAGRRSRSSSCEHQMCCPCAGLHLLCTGVHSVHHSA